MCHGAFKSMYENVKIGDFGYKFHSSQEILDAQKNYEEKKAQGIEWNPNLKGLDKSSEDDIIQDDGIERD